MGRSDDRISAMDRKYVLKNVEETEALGEELSRGLEAGDVVALRGELGVGKTTLAKAVAKGLGVRETLTSPTFNIVKEYTSGRLPLYHFDVYRVHEPEELFELGFCEYFEKGGVCLIEWADLVENLLPEETIDIYITFGEEETERTIELKC